MNAKFIAFLSSRRSIRRYLPDPIPQEMVQELLTAASWAPSAHNRQPWRFAVIQTDAVKQQLAATMGQKLRQDLQKDNMPAAFIQEETSRSYGRITSAPLLIIACTSMADMDTYPDPTRQHNEWIMATQSTALAVQNLLLAAHAFGLGACWMCAPLFCPQTVQHTLNLPPDWEPQALITIGYPAENKAKARFPVDTRTIFF
jgi:F420 biosynthesis protein FbiB-like protein